MNRSVKEVRRLLKGAGLHGQARFTRLPHLPEEVRWRCEIPGEPIVPRGNIGHGWDPMSALKNAVGTMLRSLRTDEIRLGFKPRPTEGTPLAF